MLPYDTLRLIADEREREIQARIRIHRLLGGRRSAIRWHLRGRPSEQPDTGRRGR
ncbi:MAG: hypothetical protein ACRDHD_06410 [Candidatus Limnocylindria bacterium]